MLIHSTFNRRGYARKHPHSWMDARDYGFEKSANYEVYYTKLRLQGAGAFNGAEEGLSTYAIKKIQDTLFLMLKV